MRLTRCLFKPRNRHFVHPAAISKRRKDRSRREHTYRDAALRFLGSVSSSMMRKKPQESQIQEKKARPWAKTHSASVRPSCKQAAPKLRHLPNVEGDSEKGSVCLAERHRLHKTPAQRLPEKTSGIASSSKRMTSDTACVKRRVLSAS